MGLNYNANVLQVDSSYLYSGGRYFLGLGHSFIAYPQTIQIHTHDERSYRSSGADSGVGRVFGRTQDGLAVEIACSIQFRFHATAGSLYDAYTTHGSQAKHEEALIATARGSVRDVAAQFTAYEFFQNRSEISEFGGGSGGGVL